MESTSKVLVTGGAGFIGQSIAERFAKQSIPVRVYDTVQPPFEVESTIGDISDLDKLRSAIQDCDVVIHLVGLADAGTAQREPQRSFELNVVSLQNVLELCRLGGNKKLIYPSSAAVYGMTDDLPIRERTHLEPTGIYSWHKYICENMIKAYHDNFAISYVILRLFNVYGKGNKGVINIFLEKAKKGDLIESFGPYQYRDFVYVGDVAEAFLRAALYDKCRNKVVNIGSGKGTQIRDVLNLVCELYPKAKWVEKKADFDMYDSIADITLAKILLDFEPHSSMDFMKKVITAEMI